MKKITEITLTISILLNVVVLIVLSNYLTKFNNIEVRLSILSSSINSISSIRTNTTNIQPIKEQNDIMTPSQLAVYLKIDVQQIYKSIIENQNSKFPRININGEVRFSKNAIDEYLIKEGNVLE